MKIEWEDYAGGDRVRGLFEDDKQGTQIKAAIFPNGRVKVKCRLGNIHLSSSVLTTEKPFEHAESLAGDLLELCKCWAVTRAGVKR